MHSVEKKGDEMTRTEFEESLLGRIGEEVVTCPQCGKPAEKIYSYYGKSWRCCGFRWWEDRTGRWIRPVTEEII